jgi:hypothetical protein
MRIFNPFELSIKFHVSGNKTECNRKDRRRTFLLSIFFTIVTATLQAQSGTVAAGGQTTGSGGSMSYSVGQVDFSIALGAGGTAMQGLQHPFDISLVTNVEEKEIDFTAAVYPNPATKGVTLEVPNSFDGKIKFALYDLQGHDIVKEQVVRTDQTYIPMEDLVNGVYFIRITGRNNQVKIFKVIKNQ